MITSFSLAYALPEHAPSAYALPAEHISFRKAARISFTSDEAAKSVRNYDANTHTRVILANMPAYVVNEFFAYDKITPDEKAT